MINITCVAGTRPEAIKMAPVILELRNNPDFHVTTLATGQHTDMLQQALRDFGIIPDVDMNIMKEKQSLDYITSSVLEGVGKFLDTFKQDMILVHGDTSTTFAAALAGFYRKIPVGHVEAGLRSNDLYLPFPEEANRVLTDRIASLYFAPTEGDKNNLLREGISSEKILVTGNTVIDALYTILEDAKSPLSDREVDNDRPMILMTAHRRESWGETLKGICAAVSDIIKIRNDVVFLIPLHKNPIVRNVIKDCLKDFSDNVIFTEPLNYPEFVNAMNKSVFILSDSGGVQEEASALNKPVLIMRTLSERPEAITHGTCILVGTERKNIFEESIKILNDPEYLKKIIAKNTMPFGNGTASKKIHEAIKNYFS
ncbi:MAG: UDP-N-acetylglucosamine 2-epimerase (non-hydrolyzing) [Synergistaceae bacterium]|nr:UDP-N-acetylglucosamine 2-epimerase (non-hydrolyzing) [Synergistaceae bacterium]